MRYFHFGYVYETETGSGKATGFAWAQHQVSEEEFRRIAIKQQKETYKRQVEKVLIISFTEFKNKTDFEEFRDGE